MAINDVAGLARVQNLLHRPLNSGESSYVINGHEPLPNIVASHPDLPILDYSISNSDTVNCYSVMIPNTVIARSLCQCYWLILLLSACAPIAAQEKIRIDETTFKIVDSPWQSQTLQTDASLRGLQVVSDQVMWASGTQGTVINTLDGGESWRILKISGAEELDIRDIHAIDEATVIAMTSGSPARIYRSSNGGISWKVVYESKNKQVFLDSISFLDDKNGVAMSDPIDSRLFLIGTNDRGLTWGPLQDTPRTFPGEGGFAASGTNMTTIGDQTVMIGLGGGSSNRAVRSRIVMSDDYLRSWKAVDVPIPRHPTAGIFSIHFANAQNGVVVGGDYKKPDSTEGNYAVSGDGGKTWHVPTKRKPPSGYRSCVATWVNGKEVNFLTVGPNGTDLSTDLGKTWTRISNEGFHAIQFSPDGQHGWATGSDGRVAKWLGRK